MPKELLKSKLQIFILGILLLLLIAVRAGETVFFYDPLTVYFKEDFQNQPLPHLDHFNFSLNIAFRYIINSVLSLGIIHFIFKDRRMNKFASFLYTVLGLVLFVAFLVVLFNFGNTHKVELFYLRRFLIQPLFLLLFVPAFYYQKRIKHPK